MSNSEQKSFIRKIPGFRTGTTWKMIVAVIGYGLIFLFILGIIGGLLAPPPESGATDSPSGVQAQATPSMQPSTPIGTTIVTTQPTASVPLRITGTGDDVVAFSASGTALRIFTMQHSGTSNFAIWLKDVQGNRVDLLVNEIGSYSGRKSASLSTGKYYLDITASGPWSVEISPSVERTSTTTGTSPLVLSGTGDDVRGFTTTGTGLRIFTMQNSGASNFAIWLKDGQGNRVDLLVNEIGSYNGKKSVKLTTGEYYLDISSSGSWTIEIAS